MALSRGSVSPTTLIDGLSFNVEAKNDTGSQVKINRTPEIPLTNNEVSAGANYFNSDGSISWADYNLNTGDAFQLGAPDLFMENLVNNPVYTNAIKNASDYWSNPNFAVSENASSFNLGSTGDLNQSVPTIKRKVAPITSLSYPLKRDSELDYLKITVIEYIPPGLPRDDFNTASTESAGRKKSLGTTIFLPMQSGIRDSNAVSWNQDGMNVFQARAAGAAVNAINSIGDAKFVDAFKGVVTDAKAFADDLLATEGLGAYIAAYFAGQAVGANVITRQTGAVLNNNLEMLFQGPSLRTFSYNYKFTPREPAEANNIRNIIRVLKKESAVQKANTGLFLKSPNVFDLEYIFGETGAPHPFLNNIKTCALTNITTDYTPDGSYMTYPDGSMTSYNLSLTFSELEPITRDDQEKSSGMGY